MTGSPLAGRAVLTEIIIGHVDPMTLAVNAVLVRGFRPVRVAQRCVRHIVVGQFFGRAQNVGAAFWVASHGHGVCVIGRYHDQCVLLVGHPRRFCHRVGELHRLVQRDLSPRLVMRLVDEATLDEQHESIRFLPEQLHRFAGHFPQRGLHGSV